MSPLVPVAAEDSVPLRGRRVDTPVSRAEDGIGGVAELLHEGLVVGIVASPVLAALDIEPDHAEADVVVVEVVLEGLHLVGSVAALGAGEEVDIDIRHATGPGVGDALSAVVVNGTSAAEATGDTEDVPVVLEAAPGGGGEELGAINTISGGCSADHSGEESKSKDSLHLKKKR